MKRKYHFLTLVVLTIGMFFINSGYAMAATGLSEAEELVLERLNEGVAMNGIVVRPPTAYLNQAENEFMKNEVDITMEQAAVINLKLDEVAKLVKTMDMYDVVHYKNSSTAKKLITLVEEAAAEANYTVSVDIANKSFNIMNSKGNYVFMAKDVINQTGFDLTPTVIVGGIMFSLLPLSFVIASRKKLFAKCVKA
ncbi:MAG: hypothetical protein K0S01_1885 [Herbinix sp.]|jgi:hypothetical protein|nr:hypothetical protein [Herbinix sp.]